MYILKVDMFLEDTCFQCGIHSTQAYCHQTRSYLESIVSGLTPRNCKTFLPVCMAVFKQRHCPLPYTNKRNPVQIHKSDDRTNSDQSWRFKTFYLYATSLAVGFYEVCFSISIETVDVERSVQQEITNSTYSLISVLHFYF